MKTKSTTQAVISMEVAVFLYALLRLDIKQ